MGLFGNGKAGGNSAADNAEIQRRQAAWARALDTQTLPDFVEERLKAASERRAPWVSTMMPAELLLGKSHGMRPLATVSGTCWYHYGYSWTNGHFEGWDAAIRRMTREAVAVGANAVVDVKMRTVRSPMAGSMDFTVFGTAVKFDALPASRTPILATVPAMDFVRLLEMGIAVTGLAIGAAYDFLDNYNSPSQAAYTIQQQLVAFGGNVPVMQLTNFWERIRREAHANLRRHAALSGTGVLAKTNFGQLMRVERDKQPPNYMGRHIVIGTSIDSRKGDGITHAIETVVDMRDDLSPLNGGARTNNDIEADNEYSGGI